MRPDFNLVVKSIREQRSTWLMFDPQVFCDGFLLALTPDLEPDPAADDEEAAEDARTDDPAGEPEDFPEDDDGEGD